MSRRRYTSNHPRYVPQKSAHCGCSLLSKCRRFKGGQLFHRGVHQTRELIAATILKQPCWRGAVVAREGQFIVARKGTAELRIDLGSVVAPEPVVSTLHGLPISVIVGPLKGERPDLVEQGTRAAEAAAGGTL